MYDIMTKQGCDIMAISKTGLKKKNHNLSILTQIVMSF